MDALKKYASVTDVEQLTDFSNRPLRKSMRVNTLKCSIEQFKQWAAAKQWKIEPVPWCAEGFFIDRPSVSSGGQEREALGKDLLHILGYTYMQEAASMLPVALLDPQPGEAILDMGAAPGSKTTQIAARMMMPSLPAPSPATGEGERKHASAHHEILPPLPAGRGVRGEGRESRGVIVANDVQEKRIWALSSNVQRCGVSNVMITKKVGQWFAKNMTERFDRVLCDAPCTAQGTIRKDSTALDYSSQFNVDKMARLQRDLLESAVHAAKVGGRIVYSTCTLTFEENEGVVREILNNFSTQLEVVDPRDLGLGTWDMSEAIRASEVVQQHSQVSHLKSQVFLRLWPQTYDTEGFFCAVLRKTAPTKAVERMEWQRSETLPKARAREVVSQFQDWYGAGLLRDDEVLIERKEQLLFTSREVFHFGMPIAPYVVGLPFAKQTGHLPRVSHEMATLRGGEARQQVLEIDEAQLKAILRGENMKGITGELSNGDVILRANLKVDSQMWQIPVGRGLLKNGDVLNRMPREIVRIFS